MQNEAEILVFDARGNGGGGKTVSTLTGDHQAHISDYTAIVVEPVISLAEKGTRPSHCGDGFRGGVMYTLNATEVHGVAYTLQIREGCDGGGKGPLIQEDKCGTIGCGCGQDRALFQPVFSLQQNGKGADDVAEDVSFCLTQEKQSKQQAIAYCIDHAQTIGGG